jgi:hypothetical protein
VGHKYRDLVLQVEDWKQGSVKTNYYCEVQSSENQMVYKCGRIFNERLWLKKWLFYQ